ncbi:60S ribosomal protein L37ae [Plasmodium falciparum NF54]|uniref:60S ribosomal protein L37ae n=2 Tax=Plasmodium falciparum TaxID=5833 RepID=A0A2I0BVE2_PLAFO|nr:60S ribosomal protein L37ae, putative [Plasmodium falciparum 3D7]KAF4331305.1 60S ribosomal protein L37ae [Plasmodium falciparum NF54]PKC46445.1 60S ribosomal protein L37ae [Plasmodium falciparum NF54]CZT98114.1 60S ribosomal protein L37ae, putative [Plasmodium falciparum 3D7]|eukprot:XP_024329075.1 60S ribosomal protein L37ae, putative [Plasmodium falciparum 3D7]
MSRRTKKVGLTGKYGTRYGSSLHCHKKNLCRNMEM